MLKIFNRTITLLMSVLMFVINGLAFFGLFGIRRPQLLQLSRTSVITVATFFVVYYLMSRVYGGFAIGKQKSKSIIYSMALAILGADIVTHLFMCVMDVSVNGGIFVYEQPLLLLGVFVLQVILTSVFTKLCHLVYFGINQPQKCLIVTFPGEDAAPLTRRVGQFKKQYKIVDVVSYNRADIYERIDECDAVFIYEMAVSERSAIIEYCYQTQKDVYYSIEMTDIVSMGGSTVFFDDKSMMYSPIKELSIEHRIAKRAVDIIASGIGLLLVSPIMAIVALAIKLEDHGHVFYKQKRATYNGRIFEVYKFRSMREAGSVNRSVTKDDDRITKVGAFIRKFRIDELPQLINILNGDMSLVGPRPEMLENVEKYTDELPEFAFRLRVKAGLTGLAQIYGKYNTSPKDKLIMDLMYIEKYSFWLDIKLILRTILVLLKSEESTEAFDETEKK